MRHWIRIGVITMLASSFVPSLAGAQAALDSMVANERAFAAMALASGTKAAFLHYLAEDAVVFQPTATNGRKAWEARPESRATLLWEPAFGQVASSGEMGYTTGPWEFRPAPDSSGAPATPDRYAFGHFNSVWKKQHGAWRVVADIGVSHPRPERGVGSGDFTPGAALPIRTMKSGRVSLSKLDEKLSNDMRGLGTAHAIGAHGAQDLRLNVPDRFPSLGIEAAQARFDTLGGHFRYRPQGSDMSKAGDLGYTYGLAERFPSADVAAAADTSVYLHVWRQEGRIWKLALAVLNPLSRR